MTYLSELINRSVLDRQGNRVGVLKDLIGAVDRQHPTPVVVGWVLELEGSRMQVKAPPFQVTPTALILEISLVKLLPYRSDPQDIFLGKEALDQPVILLDSANLARVRDLKLQVDAGETIVTHVDVGTLGIFRRRGVARMAQSTASQVGVSFTERCVPWEQAEILSEKKTMPSRTHLDASSTPAHPTDFALLLSALNEPQRKAFLDRRTDREIIDLMNELNPKLAARLVADWSAPRLAGILEQMEPDEAADLLARLPTERIAGLLALMQAPAAHTLRTLLVFPDDTAGGLMTPRTMTARPEQTLSEVMTALRSGKMNGETFYIYVVDNGNRLVGVVSLAGLFLAKPDAQIGQIMRRTVITVDPDTPQKEVAKKMTKYSLQALPVIDQHHSFQGIVTCKAALAPLFPKRWKKPSL